MSLLATLATSPGLVVALAAGGWLGAGAARAAGLSARSAAVLAPALTLAAWLVTTLAVGRWTGSFLTASGAGALAVGAPGAWLAVRAARAGRLGGSPRRRDLVLLAVALGLVALVLPAAEKHFHDEASIAGHVSTVSRLLRDHYPPPYPAFPEWEFRYHYGFDVLAAAIAAALHLPAPSGIDVATVGLWGYAALIAARLGELVWSPRVGVFVALGALLGGGAPFVAAPSWLELGERLCGAWRIEGIWLNPPVASYFFQHPFALGIPLALTALVVHAEGGAGLARLALLGGLGVALAHAQLVLFLTVGGSVLLGEGLAAWAREERWLARAGWLIGVGAAAAWAATRLGGFFAPGPRGLAGALQWSGGVTESTWGSLRWLAHSFGALPLLGAIGLAGARRARAALGVLVGGSLTVLVSVRYSESWDIVKFATVAQLVLGAGAGALAGRVALSRPAGAGLGRRALAGGVLLLVTIAAGAAFHVAIAADLDGALEGDHLEPVPGDDACAIAVLAPRAGRDELVYRSRGSSLAYAQAGLGSAWPDYPTRQFGIPQAMINARTKLLESLSPDLAAWRAHGIRWWVVRSERDRMQEQLEAWRAAGQAEEIARCGRLVVYRAR
ncbi:MAG: hypothetical protein IT376_19250 [Polyangiaceae bacterium]|nr:hypothetical protein [Polyangiaceae bacterium]